MSYIHVARPNHSPFAVKVDFSELEELQLEIRKKIVGTDIEVWSSDSAENSPVAADQAEFGLNLGPMIVSCHMESLTKLRHQITDLQAEAYQHMEGIANRILLCDLPTRSPLADLAEKRLLECSQWGDVHYQLWKHVANIRAARMSKTTGSSTT